MFRNWLVWSAAALALGAAPAQAAKAHHGHAKVPAPHHRYRVLTSSSGLQIDAMDEASIRHVGDNIEVTLIHFGHAYGPTRNPGPPDEHLFGQREIYRIACDWGTAQLIEHATWLDDPAKATLQNDHDGNHRFERMFTLRNRQGGVVNDICGGGAPRTGPVFPDLAALTTYAKAAFSGPTPPIGVMPPPPPLMIQAVRRADRKEYTAAPPPPPPPPFDGARHRFVLAAREEDGGGLVFLDQADLVRTGGLAEATSLWVLSDDTADRLPSVQLRRIHYDCRARTAMTLDARTYQRPGSVFFRDSLAQPPEPVGASHLGNVMLAAACGGELTGPTYDYVADAMIKARRIWRGLDK